MKGLLVLFFVTLFVSLGFSSEATARDRDRHVVVMVDGMNFVYSDRDYNRSHRNGYDRGYGYQYDRRYSRSHRNYNRGWDDSGRLYGYHGNNRGGCYRNCGQRSHYRAEPWQRYYHKPPRYGPSRHRHSYGCRHR